MSKNSSRKMPPPKRAAAPRKGGRGKAKAVLDRAPAPQGWDTSDEQELELRRWRGRTEITAVEALETEHPVFGAFRARSEGGGAYEVEIRDLQRLGNACGVHRPPGQRPGRL